MSRNNPELLSCITLNSSTQHRYQEEPTARNEVGHRATVSFFSSFVPCHKFRDGRGSQGTPTQRADRMTSYCHGCHRSRENLRRMGMRWGDLYFSGLFLGEEWLWDKSNIKNRDFSDMLCHMTTAGQISQKYVKFPLNS